MGSWVKQQAIVALAAATATALFCALAWYQPSPALAQAQNPACNSQPGTPVATSALASRTAAQDLEQVAAQAKIRLLQQTIDDLRSRLQSTESQESASQLTTPTRQITTLGFRKIDEAALYTTGLSNTDAEHVIDIANQAYEQYQQEKDLVAATESQIRTKLTTELHQHAYDSYLYAIGQRNRLEVIGFSPEAVAHDVGIKAGDIIYTLNNQRVYNQGDLQEIQSNSANPGELAALQILRGNQRLNFYLPTSRLGLQLASKRVNPATETETL